MEKSNGCRDRSHERNDTWELTNLPTEAKKVGVKWVYKTKLNENEKWISTRPSW